MRVTPGVRRFAGVGLFAVVAGGVLLGQALSHDVAAPVAQCGGSRAGVVALAAPQSLSINQDNEVRAAVASCDGHGIGDLVLLVSAPAPPGVMAGFSSDVDLGDVSGCERDHAGATGVVYLCGPLAAMQTRTLSLTVVPRRVSASDLRLAVTAVDVAGAGFDHPRLVDAMSTVVRAGSASGGYPRWWWWLTVGVAVVAGADMARRGRSGFRWALGLLVFSLLGWLVWIRDRARWQVVPAGSPPVAADEPAWVRRYGVAVGLAVPVLIVGFIVAGVVASVAGGRSSPGGPSAVAVPSPVPGSIASATPCAGGALPPAVSTATRTIELCSGAPVDAVVLHRGDTLALVLPSGLEGAGSTVQVQAQNGTDPVVDTGLGTSSSALLLARQAGSATVVLGSVCPPLSGGCPGGDTRATAFRVVVDGG